MNIQTQNILFEVVNALSEYLDNISVENALQLWNENLLYDFEHIDNNVFSIDNINVLNKVINALPEYLDENVRSVQDALELWGGDLLERYNSISN